MQFQQVAASGFNFTDDAATKRRAILTDKSLNIGYGGEPTVRQTRAYLYVNKTEFQYFHFYD